jgi:hypothetical protein
MVNTYAYASTRANPVQVLIDLLLPLWHKNTKKEKRSDATTSHGSSEIFGMVGGFFRLVVVFGLGGLRLTVFIITSRTLSARRTG